MSCFLETDLRQQQKYEKRIQKYVDNIVNDQHHEKHEKNHYCHHHSIVSAFFFLPRQILKKLDMPQQNPQHLLTAEVNFKHCTIIIPIQQIVGIVVELQLP